MSTKFPPVVLLNVGFFSLLRREERKKKHDEIRKKYGK